MAALFELLEVVPTSAVAVYAHPDDPDVACGGTLALWARRGAEVSVIVCAKGDKGSSDASTDPAELALTRSEEALAASKVLGVSGTYFLGSPDGEIEESDLRVALVGWIRRLRPEVLICPDPTAVFFGQDYFNHRDHRVVGWAALDAAAPAAASPLYFPEAGPAHSVKAAYMTGTLEPDTWVDVTSTIDLKEQSVRCHASQLVDQSDWTIQAVRRRAEEAGRKAGVGFAEGFRRLNL
ncbi:MAG: PIG-L family deacetylase [Actinobacteria bacterium]|nr:PIG-L family deacetylase [Actinomycetota bacterium]